MFNKYTVLICFFICCWPAESAVIYSPLVYEPLMVQLSANEYIAQESSGEVCLRIVANSSNNEPFSVFIMPIVKEPKSAADRDFNSSVCAVKFSVGQDNAVVCIPIYDDSLIEGNETFSVLLSVPNNTALIPGQHVIARIIILDDVSDVKRIVKSTLGKRPESVAEKVKRCGCKKNPKPEKPTSTPAVMTSTSTVITPTPVTMIPSTADITPTPVTMVPNLVTTTLIPATMTPVPATTAVTPSPTSSPVVCIGFDTVSISVNESDEFVSFSLIINGSSFDNITVFITVMMQDQPGPSTQSPAIRVSSLMINIPALFDGIIPIRIELLDDSIVEPLEFYELMLGLADNIDSSVKLGNTNMTYIVVADDDSITVAFNSSTYSGAEADGIIPVTAVATGTASIPYTVIITPSESDPQSAMEVVDFSNETIEVTFNPGETEKTVNVVINPDCLREGSEFFNLSLSLSSDTSSNSAVSLGDPSEAVAEIEDTDIIYVNFSQTLYSAEEEDKMMILTLEADRVSIWPFSVEVTPMEIDGPAAAIGGGVDFASDPLIAVFTPGASQVNVSINITKDNIFEQNEMLKFTLNVPDEFSNVNGRLLVKTGDNDMADGEIINSGVLVNFTASSYDVEVNETNAIVRVQAFGEFRNPFLVNVSTSAAELSERTEAFFTEGIMEVLFPVTINTALVPIRVFPEELRSGQPGIFNVTLQVTSGSSNVCVIIGSPSQAVVTIPSPFAK